MPTAEDCPAASALPLPIPAARTSLGVQEPRALPGNLGGAQRAQWPSAGTSVDKAEKILRLAYLTQRGNMRRDRQPLDGMDNEDEVFEVIDALRAETPASAPAARQETNQTGPEPSSAPASPGTPPAPAASLGAEEDPARFRSMNQAFLQEAAHARANLAHREMQAMMPPLRAAAAWSEVAGEFLGRMPSPEDEED